MDGNGQREGVHRGRTRGSKNLHDEEVRRALVVSHGSISSAARRLGITRQTIYNALERWPELREIVEDERELLLDKAETALYKAVKRGERWAICFMLKTRGRARGYTERQEVSKAEDYSVQSEEKIDWSVLSVEEQIQLHELIKKAKRLGQQAEAQPASEHAGM